LSSPRRTPSTRKEWDIYVHKPVHDINLPAGGRPRDRRPLSGGEARLFTTCREARNRWLLPLVQLAIETAMRRGELLRLHLEHIDLNRHTTPPTYRQVIDALAAAKRLEEFFAGA
jgi:integrase